ncbi:MAG TPA: hypothetical protein VN112_22885 [Ensifer sp.]|nr:hypothetical protein [Ensifer sp.]
MMPTDIILLWWWTAAILTALLGMTALISLGDRRRIGLDGVWAKPMKFQFSLAVHFATLAVIASALSPPWRESSLLWLSGLAAVAATIFEVGYIMFQASRQQESHFNVATPVLQMLYAMMAIGAVFITVAAGAVGLAAAIDADAMLGPATRIGSVTGLIGGTILTLVTAFRMGRALNRHVGVEAPKAPRMPVTGWSLTVGDRRVPHFFGTHFMQAGPLLGLISEETLPHAAAVQATLIICTVYVVLTVMLFVQANRGLPFICLALKAPLPLNGADRTG